MRETNHIIRKGIIDKLSGLTYLSTNIPIYDEFAPGGAILDVGNTTKCEAYVVINNQTDNESSRQTKCDINRATSIQLNIVTIFNSNSGGKIHSELICNEILQTLLPTNVLDVDLSSDGIEFKSSTFSTNSFTQDTETQRVFNKIITLTNNINYGN